MQPSSSIVEFPSPQERLGKYRLIRELGRGGMGVVYLAEDVGLGREVAVKLIHPALSVRSEYLDWFRREARLAAGLAHPNILRLHAFDEIAGRLCIETEYVPGGSLAERMRTRGLTPAEAVGVAADVLGALAVCHAAGIVHRDVKPTNILLRERGEALLTDFGIARVYSAMLEDSFRSLESSSVFVGTPRYAPPESWEGCAPCPAWDVYSTGVTLYESLAGVPPYDAVSPMALVMQVASGGVRQLADMAPELSPELCELVDAMIARNPESRPSTAEVALTRLMETPEFRERASAHPKAATLRVNLSSRRRWRSSERLPRLGRRARGGVVLGMVLLLAGLGLLFGGKSFRFLDTASSLPAPSPTLIQTLQHDLPDAASIGALPVRSEASVYTLFDHASGKRVPLAAVFYPETEGAPSGVLMLQHEGRLEHHTVATIKDGVTLTGGWGGYSDSQGTGLRTGLCFGRGTWLRGVEALTLEVEYTTQQTNAREKRVLTLERGTETDTSFILALESDRIAQPLLYRDLMPRALPWAQQLEAALPAFPNSRAYAPLVSDPRYSVTVDGKTDETVWNIPRELESDWLASFEAAPYDSGARLLFTRREDALYVLAQLPPGTSVQTFHLALLYVWRIPVGQSLGLKISVPPEGTPVVQRRADGFFQPVELPVTAARSGNVVELRIPYEEIVAHPGTDLRLRINAVAERTVGDESPQPVVRWGHPDVDAIEHGMMLELKRVES